MRKCLYLFSSSQHLFLVTFNSGDYRNALLGPSDCEKYFWRAGKYVRQGAKGLLDILNPCQTFFPVDDWQILVVILVFLVGHFMCIEPCWKNVWQFLSSLPDTSRSPEADPGKNDQVGQSNIRGSYV